MAYPDNQHSTAGPEVSPETQSAHVFAGTEPYPKVTGGRDPETVAMLKEDYSGSKGELTAITQYIFQNSISEKETYAKAILNIAISEMRHLDMLGHAIAALGGSPQFENRRRYWSSSSVNYVTDLKAMLKANIDAEKNAIASYEKHAARTKNESVKKLLERIVKDEKLHLQFFTEMLSSARN